MAVPADEKDHDSLRPTQMGEGEAGVVSAAHQRYVKDGNLDEEGVKCPSHTTDLRLLTKIDFHVIPFLCVMYLLAFLDRVNIANARIFDLETDLGIQSEPSKFNTAIVIFFVPYVLFEIPSNILLKKFKPSTWLSLNMFLFGFTTMMQGLVRSYGGLLAARFFLGLFETGMFPGAFYLIGMWYRRHEAQRRYSFFFNSTTLAGAFGGLLAAAIGKMSGMRGYSGWRWIFIIEGGLTVLVSFFFYFWLPNFPEQAKWLKEDEREYVAARLRLDQGKAGLDRSITLRDVGTIFKDYKVIVGGFMYFGLIVPAYGYAYFAPTILNGYGYDKIQTQLRSVPPWVAAFALSMMCAYASDKLRHRALFAIVPICVAISGFAILLRVHANLDAQYSALFLAAMGAFTAMPIIVCWFNMNLGGHHRRAVGSGWQVGFGNLGGIVAAFSFKQDSGAKSAQDYSLGYSLSIAFCCASIVACVIYAFGCWKANKDRRDGKQDASHLSEEEQLALGDMNPKYRYLL
ncbi:transporter-like protein [Metarhizium album ARSEF 1941]|uniref:Transporter-like protein n=1 Tax=Metarhizium album (strain ARSEF 1941) TaxID=1081103 RepID=A0A0B2X0J3_METAS|nr:transporter-like protein [Metarhizium album ARSEF 1941]KHN99364.1 transporter-like protein [Metarhizium album ARSEF 1941]